MKGYLRSDPASLGLRYQQKKKEIYLSSRSNVYESGVPFHEERKKIKRSRNTPLRRKTKSPLFPAICRQLYTMSFISNGTRQAEHEDDFFPLYTFYTETPAKKNE